MFESKEELLDSIPIVGKDGGSHETLSNSR